MKIFFFIAALLLLATAGSFAQKQLEPLLRNNQQHMDSLFRSLPKTNFLLPKSFEEANPAAVIINKTIQGTIYNMPLDNMAILVPNMNSVERIPVKNPSSKTAPRDQMPNPLYNEKGRGK